MYQDRVALKMRRLRGPMKAPAARSKAIEPARVVEQGILRSQDPTSTQNVGDHRNSAGYASLPALRRARPFGPKPPPPEALAEAGTVSWNSTLTFRQPEIAVAWRYKKDIGEQRLLDF